jgi:nucleoside-diphosphate-sugar epimerase
VLLRQALRLAGHGEAFERLSASLVASPAALTELGWRPSIATRDGLAALARDAAQQGDNPKEARATA